MRDKYDILQFHAVNSTAFAAVCTLRAIKVNFIYGMLVSSGKMHSSCRKCIGKQRKRISKTANRIPNNYILIQKQTFRRDHAGSLFAVDTLESNSEYLETIQCIFQPSQWPKLVSKVDLRWPVVLHVAVVQEVDALPPILSSVDTSIPKRRSRRCGKTASMPAGVVQHDVPGSLLLPLVCDNWHCPISM